ncbi:MAG TPA: hypothetical protein VFM54_15730 [Micromonosporaceae bacterium]|nr:hypothetical protein [Micromonosporaceae bacterium]
MAVDVGVADLVRSYVCLRDAASHANGDPAQLLLFYGVECGLKAACLGKNGRNARSTRDLPEDLRKHDLRRLAKELRLDGGLADRLLACRRRHGNEHRVDHQDLHQAWRYGAALHADDEKQAVQALHDLSEWCRKEHNR